MPHINRKLSPQVIKLELTDAEGRKLRDLLEKGEHGPDLARVHYKLTRLLQRPAIKRKFPPHSMNNHCKDSDHD